MSWSNSELGLNSSCFGGFFIGFSPSPPTYFWLNDKFPPKISVVSDAFVDWFSVLVWTKISSSSKLVSLLCLWGLCTVFTGVFVTSTGIRDVSSSKLKLYDFLVSILLSVWEIIDYFFLLGEICSIFYYANYFSLLIFCSFIFCSLIFSISFSIVLICL